jgi:hypothetical protein
MFDPNRMRWVPAWLMLAVGCAGDDAPPAKVTPTPCGTTCTDAGADAGTDAGADRTLPAAEGGIVTGQDGGSDDASQVATQRDGGSGDAALAPTAITIENALPGTATWALGQPATSHEVEGYASVTSAKAGDDVSIAVNVSAAHRVTWELYRLGYYGGAGGRLIDAGSSLHVDPQPSCPADLTTGLIECQWASAFTLTVDPTWVTGQYLIKLVRDDGFDAYVPFVVRESERRAPLLVQSSVTTWQAYNPWGGADLYMNQLAGFSGPRAHRVSFDRPYVGLSNADVGAGQLFATEIWMFRWLEMQGYDLSYVTDLDVHGTAGLLDGRRLFMSVGHDEYWSVEQRDAVQKARDEGLSIGFFSANTAYWRTRVDPSSTGAPARVLTCYKDSKLDPTHGAPDTTMRFRDTPDSKPEDALIGQMYELFTLMDGFPIAVSDPTHWVYAGTSVARGDTLSHVVGNEWDHVWPGPNEPASLEVLAHSDAFGAYGSDVASEVAVYYPTPASFVFSSGTIHWSWGLGKEGYSDPRIQKMTENVLARAGLHSAHPIVVPPPVAPVDVGNASAVTLVAGSGVPGAEDGTADTATLNAPAGVVADEAGNVYVTEARNHRIRRVAVDGTVTTLAGCGPSDVTTGGRLRDGSGSQACFSVPTGIALGPDGNLYISDSHDNRIRAMTPTGDVTTFAGTGANGMTDAASPLSATFSYPRGLAFGPDGALYVADAGNTAVRRIGKDGVTTVAKGSQEISGVAVAPDGTLYALTPTGVDVVDSGMLVPIVNVPGIAGDRTGDGATAMLRAADGIIVDGDFLVVSDSANYKVRRIERFGRHRVTTLAGDGRAGADLGTGATAHLVNPRGLALTPLGYVVADSGNDRLVRIRP